MKTALRRAMFLIICALCLLPFSGCGADHAGKLFSCDIPSPISGLDPQYATDPAAKMIITNIFEGLFTRRPDGSLSPGAAYSYEISANGLEYTFHLRRDAGWAGEKAVPVTAGDFVFALRRLFNPAAPSPYASDYIHILNARDILSGVKSQSSLGARAKDDFTLVITLEQESPFFLQLLAEIAAMPCDRTLFDAAMGRYGLEAKLTGSNGPFYISRWTDSQISLLPNENYRSESPALAGGAHFHIARGETLEYFLEGDTDVSAIPYSQAEAAASSGCTVESFDSVIWCIAFNLQSQTWSSPLLRQGLAQAVDYGYFSQRLSENFKPASVLAPPAVLLGDKPYRDYAGEESPLKYDPASALRLYKLGLDTLEYSSLPATTFYVPDTEGHALNMGLIQQSWQKTLSAFINIKPIPLSEIERRFISGEYQIMLTPFSQDDARIESLLSRFSSSSAENRFGYKNPRYDQIIIEARDQASAEMAAMKYWQAEKTLLADAVVIPVYTETIYYATAKGVSGLDIFPFGGKLYFKNALRS